jgi:hypothetical protein
MTKKEKKLQCIEQIKEKSKEIENELLIKLNRIIDSGAIPDLFMQDNYLLIKAILDSYCLDRQYSSRGYKKEFANLHKFM